MLYTCCASFFFMPGVSFIDVWNRKIMQHSKDIKEKNIIDYTIFFI